MILRKWPYSEWVGTLVIFTFYHLWRRLLLLKISATWSRLNCLCLWISRRHTILYRFELFKILLRCCIVRNSSLFALIYDSSIIFEDFLACRILVCEAHCLSVNLWQRVIVLLLYLLLNQSTVKTALPICSAVFIELFFKRRQASRLSLIIALWIPFLIYPLGLRLVQVLLELLACTGYIREVVFDLRLQLEICSLKIDVKNILCMLCELSWIHFRPLFPYIISIRRGINFPATFCLSAIFLGCM
jgi:hypothetical protein